MQLELMRHFLVETGQRFERKQQAEARQGRGRTYVVVLAHENVSVKNCFDRMFAAFHQEVSAAIDPVDVCGSLRLMRFCMLSSSMCSMHILLRIPRGQLPYALFELISPGKDPREVARKLVRIPTCLQEDLFKMIVARYPLAEDLASEECLTVVEALAQQFAVDIAAIEAKHSTNRDFSLLRSKGWVTSLEPVSARFNIQHFGFQAGPARKMASRQTKNQPKKLRKRRGGGGALRAFISASSRGQKGKPNLKRLGHLFKQLPDEELQRYKEIGAAGTLAHRKGYASFGKIKRKRRSVLFTSFQKAREAALKAAEAESILPGDVTADGAHRCAGCGPITGSVS